MDWKEGDRRDPKAQGRGVEAPNISVFSLETASHFALFSQVSRFTPTVNDLATSRVEVGIMPLGIVAVRINQKLVQIAIAKNAVQV